MEIKLHAYLSPVLDRNGPIHSPADLSLGKPPLLIVYQGEWVQRQYGDSEDEHCCGSSRKQLHLLSYFGSCKSITTRTSVRTIMMLLLMTMNACVVDAATQLNRSVKKSTPKHK
jgi:hypothetical protein